MVNRAVCQKLVLLVIGLAAGSSILIPTSYGSFHPVTSSEIQDGTIQSADIGSGQVKAADISAGAVNSAKIADGTIGYGDAARSFFAMEHRDDCNCGGTGWDPDGTKSSGIIWDDRITPDSAVFVTLVGYAGFNVINCGTVTQAGFYDYVVVNCDKNIPANVGINYAVFNK